MLQVYWITLTITVPYKKKKKKQLLFLTTESFDFCKSVFHVVDYILLSDISIMLLVN